MKDSTLWSTSGNYTYKADYYVQKVDGNGYDLHHTDTIKMNSNPTIGKEDCYAISGFTFENCNPRVGESYNNAKFYYKRNSYDLNFINNGEHEKLFLRSMNKVFQMKTILLQDQVHYQIIMNLMVGTIINFVRVKNMSLMERQCQHKM